MTSDTSTENRPTDSEERTDRPTMGGVDHTHPERNTTFGSIFCRGPSVAADGGEPAGTPDVDDVSMADVDHEAPSDTGANATFERGAEHDGGGEHASDAENGDPIETDQTVVADEAPTDE